MEAYSNPHHVHTRTSHLTKLYSDAKKSALINIEVQPNATYQFSALHRKYRIQKDRLITWGLAWSDDERGPDGNIDESVARAGLTETVDSVLRNIKEVTDEAERIKAASVPGLVTKGGDNKLAVQPFDEARYEDLLRDLTTSIDTLYDLSRSRKALARGEHPTFSPIPASVPEEKYPDEKPTSSKAASIRKRPLRAGSYASSEATLVNPPPFTRPTLSPYAGLPPRIDVSALRLPEEGPPPYESIGVPLTTRLVGRLIRAKASESVQNATGSSAAEVPVLVEYANFDSTYRDTGVPPPLQRLESLANFFQPMRPESQTNLSLLGYFEDFQEPRIGLIYDLPYAIQNRLQGTVESAAHNLTPISLLKLVQKTNKPQKPGSNEIIVPSLEDRFFMALRLVEQLHSFHTQQIAHGNINSSSVIFTTTNNVSPTSQNKQLRSPLWSAFDLFSKCSVEGVTRTTNLNIYRHPEDHPQSPGRSTSVDIKFDMYSLAVILLEIGLWTPIGELYKTKYTLADFKLRLEKLWIPKLASKCGSSYMRAVQGCVDAADDLDLSDSMPVIESAYELLMRNLRRCCLLDENVSIESFAAADFVPEPVAPAEPSKVRRKPLPAEKKLPSLPAKLQKANPSMRRTLSEPVTETHTGTGSNPQATLLAPFNPDELSRQPSIREEVSREDTMQSLSSQIISRPSFVPYKSKVIFIQQTWREYRARCLEAEVLRAEGNARMLAEAEADDEKRVKPKRKEFPHLPIPQSVLEEWHSRTSVQLARLVEKALKGSPESSSISLTAYGETPETARPTYLVCCTSTAKVKHVLKRHFKFDSSMCDLRVKKDEIRRCHRSRRARLSSEAQRSMAPGFGDIWTKARNPDYQEKPLCGASIGAFRDDEHLPPVSFGGIVVVDGVSYGMSVHHMLEAEDDDDDESNPDEDDESDASSIRSFDNESISSESDDASTVRPRSTIPDVEDAPDTHDGDCPGIVPGDYEEITITQPALDDAIELDLHVDEDEDDDEDSGIDEDHLLSYKLGQVHASSGLKRTPNSLEGGFKGMQSMPQEIDWALFELVPPRAHPYNVIRNGAKYCSALKRQGRDTCPVAIRESSELACAKVHCIGRTSGLGSGTISTQMELVKIHGRSTFSASWTVDGDFGVGGDSGAWVFSNDDGRVCGHVVASRRGRTYICPMDLLLEDIKTTLDATEVSLPIVTGVEDEERTDEETEQALREAVKSLNLQESESGGVAVGNMRQSSSRRHFAHAHAVGVAG